MAHSEPKVTIDLAEYNELLEIKQNNSNDINLIAFTALLNTKTVRNSLYAPELYKELQNVGIILSIGNHTNAALTTKDFKLTAIHKNEIN